MGLPPALFRAGLAGDAHEIRDTLRAFGWQPENKNQSGVP